MTITLNNQDITSIVTDSAQNGWAYAGAFGGIWSLEMQNIGKVFNDANLVADQVKAGLLTDAHKF